MQSKIRSYNDVCEWIPYNQFTNMKEIYDDGFVKMYSAIWKDGPLYYDYFYKKELTRIHNKKVALKCLYNSQNIIDKILNEVQISLYFYVYALYIIYSKLKHLYLFIRLKNIIIIILSLKYMVYLIIQIQIIILWFFKMDIVKNVEKYTRI
jgi:hypothetical protein